MTAQRVPSATAKTAENAYGFDLNCRTEEHKGEYGGRLHPSQTTDLGRMSYLTAPTTDSRDIQATARQMEDKFVQRPTLPKKRKPPTFTSQRRPNFKIYDEMGWEDD